MVKTPTSAITRIRPNLTATMWWLTDSLGAIPIAAAIALAVNVGTGTTTGMLAPAVLVLIGGSLRALAVFRANLAGQRAAMAATTGLRAQVHLALLPTRMISGRLVGEDMQLGVDSILATEGQVARFLPLRAASSVSPLLIALAVAPASWIASLILLATLIPFVLALVLAGSAAARRAESQHGALNQLAGLFADRLRSMPTILGFGAEDRVARHLGEAARHVAERTMDVLAIAFASSAVLEFFAALSVALVAVYCGFSLLGLLPFPAPEHLTGLRAFFTLAMAPEFYLGMRRLAAAYHDKQEGDAAMAALNAEMARIPVAVEPISVPSHIAGHGVAFAHIGGETIGLLNWCWSSRGLHAIAGPTGSGKSTLLLGLIGQVPLVAGNILADGAGFAPAALNAAIGWAGQQVALLPGSLRSNLAMGKAEDAAMTDCLQSLGLGSMLAQRGGLGTMIDHRGSGLSGGERRRIGLAQAILSGRQILLLDEPTADLDDATAATICSVRCRLATDHLVIVATHDAEMVAMAHTILRFV